ncbi:helix-turn-helix domain-containing protein [Paenibacillus thailandensis]|uniref:Helix-turn-helix domain-containing protein n=1 Tax=Paenibacillus thailandensis TaxID=393250 RepID=A0ABW5R0K0_9BACL
MLTIHSAYFDDFIPKWRTHDDELMVNVLILVTEGKVSYLINNEHYVGERGDFIFIPRSSRRTGDNHPSGPHQKHTVLFQYDDTAAASIPFLLDRKVIRFKLRNFQYVLRRFQRLYEELRNGGTYRGLICQGILLELVAVLARELEKPEVAPMKMKYAQIVKRYLIEHYREPIEIEQLARLIHRSPNYTISVFSEVFGHSPIKYVHQLRVMEACNLLLHSDMTIANISEYLGYYDASYFFRVFKKYTSMSPTDFKLYGNPNHTFQVLA